MSYKLYTDKLNKFNCDIQIEGTSLAKSKVRLVLETNDISYMFYGRIENNGVCEVKIPKTKDFLSEGSNGLMKLEVIADDVFFQPWSSEFMVETDKKMKVSVKPKKEKKEEDNSGLMNEIFDSFTKQKENKIVDKKSTNNLFFTKKDILKRLI